MTQPSQSITCPCLTFTGAEAILLVRLEVGCGGAPGQVVGASVRGAAAVGLSQEDEGKVAQSSLCVPVLRLHN